jgi:hypothetical protein
MTLAEALKILDRILPALEQCYRVLLEARRFVLAHTELPGADNLLAEIVDAQRLLNALLDDCCKEEKGVAMRKGRRGGVEVYEILLGMPILVMLIVLLINGGFAVYANQVVQEAARSGCRLGVVSEDPAGTARKEALHYGALPGARRVEVDVAGDYLVCQVSYDVPTILPDFFPHITVTGRARYRMEGW